MRRRLGSLGLLLTLLFSIVPAALAASDSLVTVDNSAGNSIATGTVVRSDPSHALLEVRNNYHFWVAVDVVSAHGAVLRPAALSEDLGGLFAGGALINPSGTAAWDGVFDSSTGGLATIRVHYDVTSAGGAVALAGNVLTIIADSLGASLAASSASGLVKSFTLIMDLPSFADFGREIQQQDVWGLVTSMELLLGSPTGRATIKEALSELGVLASDSQLLKVASVVGIIDWAQTLVDLMRASISGTTDGSVTFSLAGPTPTLTPTPTPTPTAAPTPLQPPPSPTNVTSFDLTAPSYQYVECSAPVANQGLCGKVRVQWHWATSSAGTQVLIYWVEGGFWDCFDPNGCGTPPTAQQLCMGNLDSSVLVGQVSPGLETVDVLTPTAPDMQCVYVVAKNQAGSSGKVWAINVTPQ